MKSIWYSQLKPLLPILFRTYIPVLCILFAIAIIRLPSGVAIHHLTRDPSAITRTPFYFGLLSNIGVLLWCCSATVCFFSSIVLQKNINNSKEFSSFLLFSGLITVLLLLDDFFLLHEEVFPYYLNVPEKVVYTGYGIAILIYLLRFRTTIVKTEFLLLFFAFAFLGLSVNIDLLQQKFSLLETSLEALLEDGTKLLGIVSWCTYFVRLCIQQVRSTVLFQQTNQKEVQGLYKIQFKQPKVK